MLFIFAVGDQHAVTQILLIQKLTEIHWVGQATASKQLFKNDPIAWLIFDQNNT